VDLKVHARTDGMYQLVEIFCCPFSRRLIWNHAVIDFSKKPIFRASYIVCCIVQLLHCITLALYCRLGFMFIMVAYTHYSERVRPL